MALFFIPAHCGASFMLRPVVWAFGRAVLAAIIAAVVWGSGAGADSRIKDIVDVEGVRDNPLLGYGLVVGLNGTGDSPGASPQTQQSLEALLEQFGVNTRGANINPTTVAAVVITADLPPFAMQGARIDVTVSATGDASDLSGGTLLAAPLYGADNQVYAVAQGAVASNGFSAQGNGASVTRNIPTGGRISNGAIVEREIGYDFGARTQVRLALRNPDFATATQIADVINRFMGAQAAQPLNPGMVLVTRPDDFDGDAVALVTAIEQLPIVPEQPAKIVIDDANGIVVMGADVRVSTVAIAQGALTIAIAEAPQVSQPAPFAPDGTPAVVVPRTNIEVEEQIGGLSVVEGGVPLSELVNGLNALGVSPRDLISILQALKRAGAIQADIEVI